MEKGKDKKSVENNWNIFLIIVIGIVVLFAIISNMQSAPKEYWKKINCNSDIENKYNKLGKYEVEKKEYDAPQDSRDKNDNHFVVWSPKEK